MKTRILLILILIGLTSNLYGQSEERVRYILADITCGGPVAYYRQHLDDKNAREAVNRWENGVRVTNPNSFERKIVNGSWTITYKGTNRAIDGMDVKIK